MMNADSKCESVVLSKRYRILVTDAETTKALAIVRGLGPEMEVWTASASRIALAGWSRYAARHLVYCLERPGDLSTWLLRACKCHEIDVVICPEEQSSFLVARDNKVFADEGIVVTTPPFDALRVAMDKALTIEAAKEVGIPVPETRLIENIAKKEEVLQAAREIGFPVVIKPRFSHYWDGNGFVSSDGVSYAASEGEVCRALENLPGSMPGLLLQRFVPGEGLGVSLIIGHEGSVCAAFGHQRMRDLRPTGSGSVLRRSIALEPRLLDWSVALLRHINWQSVAMVEFRRDPRSSTSYLMEINGRFWGSLQLAIDAGVNFPHILVKVALGHSVVSPDYERNVMVRWWLGDLMRTIRILKGKPGGFVGEFPSRWSGLWSFLGPQPAGTKSEVLRWYDPLPAVGELLYTLGKVLT